MLQISVLFHGDCEWPRVGLHKFHSVISTSGEFSALCEYLSDSLKCIHIWQVLTQLSSDTVLPVKYKRVIQKIKGMLMIVKNCENNGTEEIAQEPPSLAPCCTNSSHDMDYLL